jgi:hypothetical protein
MIIVKLSPLLFRTSYQFFKHGNLNGLQILISSQNLLQILFILYLAKATIHREFLYSFLAIVASDKSS